MTIPVPGAGETQTTRAQLDALILQYLNRANSPEAQGMVGGWVALAEADIRQRLRAPWMLRIAPSVDIADISQPFRLPDSYLAAQAAYLLRPGTTSMVTELQFIAPSQLGDFLGQPGCPQYICVQGHYAQIVPGSGPVTYQLIYYSMGDGLSDPTSTNENLAHAVNIYLYAALRHAWFYYSDDEKMAAADAAFQSLVEEINGLPADWQGGSGLRVMRRRR